MTQQKQKIIIENLKNTIFSDNSETRWIVLNNPEKKDLETLKQKYKFHKLDIEDCLSKAQRPKIDEYLNYIFSVIHIPVLNKEKTAILKSQVYFFIGKNYVITIHDNDSNVLKLEKRLKTNRKARSVYMDFSSAYLLYMIIDYLFKTVFPVTEELQEDLYNIEHELFDKTMNTDKLKDILTLKKALIVIRRMISPQRALIGELDKKSRKYDGQGLEIYFDEIADKVEKIWNNLENMNELLISLFETNESLTSHNTNNTIKMLTIFSVLIMPMTLITGFYGMNVAGLPMATHPLSTLMIGIGFIVLAGLMVVFFKIKKWI